MTRSFQYNSALGLVGTLAATRSSDWSAGACARGAAHSKLVIGALLTRMAAGAGSPPRWVFAELLHAEWHITQRRAVAMAWRLRLQDEARELARTKPVKLFDDHVAKHGSKGTLVTSKQWKVSVPSELLIKPGKGKQTEVTLWWNADAGRWIDQSPKPKRKRVDEQQVAAAEREAEAERLKRVAAEEEQAALRAEVEQLKRGGAHATEQPEETEEQWCRRVFVTLWEELKWARWSIEDEWPEIWNDYCEEIEEPVHLEKLYEELALANPVRARIFFERFELLLRNAVKYNVGRGDINRGAQAANRWLSKYYRDTFKPKPSAGHRAARKVSEGDVEYFREVREKQDSLQKCCENLYKSPEDFTKRWDEIVQEIRERAG